MSKDNSEYENKNIKNFTILGYKNNKNNNNIYLNSMFNITKRQEIKSNSYKINNYKQKNYNIRNTYNNNSNKFMERNNTSISDLNESVHSKIKIKDHTNLKNSEINNSTASYSINYNNLHIFKEKDKTFSFSNNIPEIIKLSDMQAYLKNKKPESKIVNNNAEVLIDEYTKYTKKQKELKESLDVMRKKEMDRIFNEYLRNNYYQRYKVEKNVVLSALIGEDNINNELNRQIKRAKKYFDNAKSYSLGHKRVNKKIFKFDKINQMKLKTMVGDTFLGGIY